MDQKMMKILGAIIAGFVVFILILFLISSCSKTNYTPEKIYFEIFIQAHNVF